MTDQETKDKLKMLRIKESEQLDKVRKEYAYQRQAVLDEWAKEHTRFNVGDILQMGSIKICVVLIIGCQSTFGDYLYVTYYGPTVTNKFLPTKDGFHTTVYDDGREIIKLNK